MHNRIHDLATDMSCSVTSSPSSSLLRLYQQHRHQTHSLVSFLDLTSHSHSLNKSPLRLHATRRTSNGLVDDPRNWGRSINSEFVPDGENDDDDDDDEEEEDRSLDLLVRFVANVFKKTSKRARKAVRSVLPVPISTKLVEFSVNGVLVLAFLWVLKAFLEVVCTVGSVVFVSILLIRGVWTGVTYLQERRHFKMSGFDDDHSSWNGSQPAT